MLHSVALLLFFILGVSQAFVTRSMSTSLPVNSPLTDNIRHSSTPQLDTMPSFLADLPAQAEGAVNLYTSALKSGPYGVVALAVTSAAVLFPITQYKNILGISVGYGTSVATIALMLRTVLSPDPLSVADVLSGATLFYGFRLATYLSLRTITGWKPSANRPEPSRLKRIPFALSLSIFYAFMMTPVMYALRSPPSVDWMEKVAWAGTGVAWFGVALETIADAHKFIVKTKQAKENNSIRVFEGPFNGVYQFTRHPNYTGEILVWLGTWLAGTPSFGKSIVGWLCGTAGLYGIITIMRGATKGLEKRQEERYGGQRSYEEWKEKSPYPLFPFVKESEVKEN